MTETATGTTRGVDGRETKAERGNIRVDEAAKTYGQGAGAVRALEPVSFDIAAGDFVSIVGPSGCGKTTLLKIVGNIISASSGTVTIDGDPNDAMRRQRRIGYVFQTPVLLSWRTAEENVRFPFEIAGIAPRRLSRRRHPSTVDERVARVLKIVGLDEFANRLPHELSGGMQARVALARALVYEPTILLMDEPFASLDELTRSDMGYHLLEIWERIKTTVLFVTHHIEEAALLSNRILVMSPRPGSLRRSINVDLPRPRSLATRRLPLFRSIVEELMEEFHGSHKG